MQQSRLRLYLPFLAVVAAQAVIMTTATSTTPDRSAVGAIGAFDPDAGPAFDPTAPIGAPATTTPFATGGTAPVGGSTAAAGDAADAARPASPVAPSSQASAVTPSPTPGQPAPTSDGSGDAAAPPAPAAQDTSHCVGDRQFDVLIDNPQCVPAFPDGADNGGATAMGVTGDTIKVVYFENQQNAAVNAVLGGGTTDEDVETFFANAVQFMENRYELYGRSIEIVRVVSDCPTTPPDPATCKESAREAIAEQPFAVIWLTNLYPTVFDEFARAGIIAFGGRHHANNYFADRRPFRYDLFMDGTRTVELIAEYWCKKLAGKNATHAGRTIHPSFPNAGARDLTPRKVGITVEESDANVRSAEELKAFLAACGTDTVISTFAADIERAQEQGGAITQRFIQNQVSSVIHLADPISPAFLFTSFSQQNYYPEIVQAGGQLLDTDTLARVYPQDQMAHAFGLGHSPQQIPFEESNVARMYRDVGSDAEPCGGCGMAMGYIMIFANGLHLAGPQLDPLTYERAMLTQPSYGGDKPGSALIQFGANDYTGVSDTREIYWSQSAISPNDGQPGTWISPNDHRRYRLGEFDSTFDDIPVPVQ